MDLNAPKIALEDGLDVSKLFTTGSVLHINEDYDVECHAELEDEKRRNDYIGKPIQSFQDFEKELKAVDEHGLVKKKILEEGGGLPLNKENTVSVAFTGYWEGELEPFDFTRSCKPLVVNLNENGLLPGIQIAIESMLVGEVAVFLLSYEVMYGEMGVPPRIKPKADCIFYIELIKSILTSKEGKINFSEPNMFERVHHEVKMLYSSGITLHKMRNYLAAIQMFRKGVNMLHKCRLADMNEECIQEKLLVKLYTNLAVCYNEVRQPLKTCIACKELNRLNHLWNSEKALYQNAKALRMIGQFEEAEKRLKRALKLCPDNEALTAELTLIKSIQESCNQTRLVENKVLDSPENIVNDQFKKEVDNLVENFKNNLFVYKLTLPGGLNEAEIDYIKSVCEREKLFCNKSQKKYLLDKDEEEVPIDEKYDLFS